MSGMDRLTATAEDMKLNIISKADTTPLVVSGDGFWIVKFLHDGTVEFNDKLTPKQGSEEAWQLLQAEARRASQPAHAPQKPIAWAETDHKGKVIGVSMNQYPWHPTPLYAAPAPSDGLREAARLILSQPKRPDTLTAEAFHAACGFLDEQDGVDETTNEIIEAFLKHIAGED